MSSTQRQELLRFRDHIRQLSVRTFPENRDGFDTELADVRTVDQRVRSNLDEYYTGSLGSSMAKNRFDDVKPNEGTLVHLQPASMRGDGTYINANYIDARATLGVPFVYIATQAPMSNTVLDFWRMVYENDVSFIVMLCGVKENGKIKSEMYWPARGTRYDLGLLSITTVSENVRAESVHRTLCLRTVRGDEREIFHMQHTAWPDQGVPEGSAPLMEMMQAIGKSPRNVESPIVVHCSGGVGRTGVFIGMHIALAQFQLERINISVPSIVRFLKLCRTGMVQRKDQYLFLYYATLREIERMVISAEKGVNLLDVRARNPRQYQQHQVSGSSSPRRALPPPRVMPIPTGSGHGPVELIRSLVKDRSRKSPLPSQSSQQTSSSQHWESPVNAKPAQRSEAADVAIMQEYLNQRRDVGSTPILIPVHQHLGLDGRESSVGTSISPSNCGALSAVSCEPSSSSAHAPAPRIRQVSPESSALPLLHSPHMIQPSSPTFQLSAFVQMPSSHHLSWCGDRPPSSQYCAFDNTLEGELMRMQAINRMKRATPSGSPQSRTVSLSGSPRNGSLSLARDQRDGSPPTGSASNPCLQPPRNPPGFIS